jgi:Sortase domain
MEITTRRRRAVSTALALLLVVESVSAMAAVAVVGRDADAGSRHDLPAAAPAGVVDAAQGAPAALTPRAAAVSVRAVSEDPDTAGAGPNRTTSAPAPARAFAPRFAISSVKAPKARAGSSGGSSSGSSSSSTASSGSYKGRNHLWFPAIGLSRAVYSYSCGRKSALANLVYRWGCGGTNNTYLMGHAWGVFKPLHDAYVNGRLHAGMKAYYADSNGRTHTYVVKWWKLTRPTTAAKWAWASQSVPSMTLQTCVGANSEYRVMVRLVEVR